MKAPAWCTKPKPCDYDRVSAYCPHRECRQSLEDMVSTDIVEATATISVLREALEVAQREPLPDCGVRHAVETVSEKPIVKTVRINAEAWKTFRECYSSAFGFAADGETVSAADMALMLYVARSVTDPSVFSKGKWEMIAAAERALFDVVGDRLLELEKKK